VLGSVIENLIRRFSNQSLELAHSVDNLFCLILKKANYSLTNNHYKIRIHHISIKSLKTNIMIMRFNLYSFTTVL